MKKEDVGRILTVQGVKSVGLGWTGQRLRDLGYLYRCSKGAPLVEDGEASMDDAVRAGA